MCPARKREGTGDGELTTLDQHLGARCDGVRTGLVSRPTTHAENEWSLVERIDFGLRGALYERARKMRGLELCPMEPYATQGQ